ncbi:MAG: hypothetical protein H0V00_01020 [Chloroflexia bacterium]|nr:hypothetical protein [Chloroflexia bacterium]
MHDVRIKVARIAFGAALTAALVGFSGLQPVAAQDDGDDTIVLTAGGSTLTVSPGHADAVSAIAEAHASPGHAETIGAAARAVADCEDGALAEGAAALAVAHPDEGAMTQSSAREMVATIQGEVEAAIRGEGDSDDSPIRTVVEHKCHVDKEEKKAPPAPDAPAPAPDAPAPAPEVVVVQVPDTGIGMAGSMGLSSLFAAASAAAALGAVSLRGRRVADLFSR